MYSCQIYDNGTLIRDYVPCITPDNEAGLYDLVNGAFYANMGSGAFKSGPEASLITDRTLADVATVSSLTEAIKNGTATAEQVQQYLDVSQKGSYNYTDFNRVEKAVQYVANRLKEFGYDLAIRPGETWTMEDKPNKEDFDRYFWNIAQIRAAIAVWKSTPEAPNSVVGFDITKANALEQILVDVDLVLNKIQAAWFFLGDLHAGEV
jgi:hypothetical protein